MERELQRYERWSKALDSRFSLFGIRFGWDSVLGLIPGVGDAVTVIPAVMMINDGYRAGVRKRALGKMAFNTAVDLAVGSIPLVGDLFDVAFKSHRKNVAVLRNELARRQPSLAPQPAE